MTWNWQLPDWPNFKYDALALSTLEKEFFKSEGGEMAILMHLDEEKKRDFVIEMLCIEGLNSAEVEGEILQRESLQYSIQRHFGLTTGTKKVPPEEQSMGDLMWRVYDTFQNPLTHEMLYEWHALLLKKTSKISDIGKYRTHSDPMQIIAGRYDKHEVHFEAPPSTIVHQEMARFIEWFNYSSQETLALEKAAITHVYFESIHPFEDGNGRIGRALVEKILSQNLGYPTLIAVSQVITKRKKEYYAALGQCNRTLNIQGWVLFFSEIIVESQKESLMLIHFLMGKSLLMNKLEGHINDRQNKVLLRMFAEGVNGFSGGLSAENYIAITKTSKATATRDLADLVEKEALYKTGQLRHTRYGLNIRNE